MEIHAELFPKTVDIVIGMNQNARRKDVETLLIRKEIFVFVILSRPDM
jgi:hypothetical protein